MNHSDFDFEVEVYQSMMGSPTHIATHLNLAEMNRLLILEVVPVTTTAVYFYRQAHPGGAWRSIPATWGVFMDKNPIFKGDILTFTRRSPQNRMVLYAANEPIIYDVSTPLIHINPQSEDEEEPEEMVETLVEVEVNRFPLMSPQTEDEEEPDKFEEEMEACPDSAVSTTKETAMTPLLEDESQDEYRDVGFAGQSGAGAASDSCADNSDFDAEQGGNWEYKTPAIIALSDSDEST